MRNLPSANTRAIRKGQSHYHLRFLFILWAVLLSILVGFAEPVSSAPGYQPVYNADSQIQGATTKAAFEDVVTNEGFLHQEIIAQKFVPTATPTLTPTPQEVRQYGKSRQIGEYTWTIEVGEDERTGTPQEIFQALNEYRQKKGKGTLSWDDRLASYARERAELFDREKKTDSHAGFKDYLNNQNGFDKLGFMRIGENSSYGYKVLGVHLIEWVYAGDQPHDDNQLSSEWSHVGVGASGLGTDLIFAGRPQ